MEPASLPKKMSDFESLSKKLKDLDFELETVREQ